MKSLTTEIEIDATPTRVWEVLTDMASYEAWNSHIVAACGDVEKGERLRLAMKTPAGKTMKFSPVVTVATPGQSFEWHGSLGIKGIFDGRHRFDLEETQSGTRLVQSEEFTGVLAPALFKRIGEQTQADFERMNAELKERVERGT